MSDPKSFTMWCAATPGTGREAVGGAGEGEGGGGKADMMTLSKRLRSLAYQRSACGMDSELEVLCADRLDAVERDLATAHARLERLEASNASLRGALEEIASGARYSMYDTNDCFAGLGECRDIARKALEDDK